MANDNHFRIKNGLKVGNTEVISESAKISTDRVFKPTGEGLTPTVAQIETDVSALQASLGDYETSLNTLTLIQASQVSASSSLSSTLLLELSASSAKSGAEAAEGSAQSHASDANLDRLSASAARSTAQDHKASASASKSAALVLKGNIDNLKDTSSSAEVAIQNAKASASAAKSAALVAKEDAVTAAGESANSQDSALAHARCALFGASSALSAYKSASASESGALASQAQAGLYADDAASAATSASGSFATASLREGLAANSATSASANASAANASQGLAFQYEEAAASSATTASAAAVTAENKRVLAVEASSNSQTAANNAKAAKESASASESAANSSKEAANESKSSAESSRAAASIFAEDSASAATSASGSFATAEEKRGLAANAATLALLSASSASASQSASNVFAESASGSLSATLISARSASASESAALVSQSNASTFANNAADSESNASSSAASAEIKKGLSANSATLANDSANSASASKSAALISKKSASSSESAALSSEKSASASNSAAIVSAANAFQSEEASASSATTASGNAATAETKQLLAASSLLLVEQSESSASSSKSAANVFAASASASRSAALNSERSASASLSSAIVSAANAFQSEEASASSATTASGNAATAETKQLLAASSELLVTESANSASSSKSSASLSETSASASKSAALLSARSASSSSSSANISKGSAQISSEEAVNSKLAASSASVSADTRRGLAVNSSVTALESANSASSSKSAAGLSAQSASSSRSSANSSRADAEIFAQESANSKTTASSSAVSADTQRGLAVNAATAAQESARSASGAASAANLSKASASNFADDAASAATSASASFATAESRRSLAAQAATSADESRSAAVSANLVAGISKSAAKSSAAAADIFAQDASTAAASSSSARASAISAKDIAVNAATAAETSANTVNLSSIAILNPSRVGTDEKVWAYQPHSKDLDTNDSRFVQTGVFPNNSFVTDDATFGNAFVFPDTENKSFGPRLSFAYGSDKVYLMTVTYRTVQNSDTEYNSQYGVRTLLGATTRGDNGVTLAENIQDFEQRTTASAGETVFAGVIHGEDYTDQELDSLPIITSTLTSNTDESITDRITTAQTFGQNAGASGPATSISFAIRQNAGEATDGQIAVKSFEVRDITEIVLAQIESASAQNSASAANSSRAAAGISASDAAESKSDASSAAASATSSKELSANSETAARNSSSAANSARASARAAELSAIQSASNASSANASASNFKELAANSETAARLSASSASASKAAAKISEDNAAQSESNASSSNASAVSNKELSANSATLAGAAKDLAVSAQNAATEQSVENQNLIATGGFIGKNTFEDNDDGRWTTNDTPLIADEGLPAHPLGRTRAYKSDARDAYYSALNTNEPGFYEQSAHNRTFKFTGYCYNANVAGAGQDPVDARAGLRSWNGNTGNGTSHWPTIIAASAATTGWVYYSGTITVNDPDGAYLAPFLQNSGFVGDGDSLLSYWTDMTMEDVTASESARKSASAANSARGAALISETAAASSATSANSAEGAAETSKLLAASAQLLANKDASSAESARAAAEIFESDASQAKLDASSANASAETARGLSVNAQTVAQNAASVAAAASQASAQNNLNQYFFARDSEGRGWSNVTGTGTEGGDPYLEWSDAAFHLPAYDNLKVGDVYRLTGQYNTVGNSHNCKFMFREENGGWIENGYEVLEGDNTLEPGTSWSSFNILLRSKINRERFTIAIDTSDPAPHDDRLKVKNLLWVDVTEEYNTANSASSAQSSFGAADIARGAAVNARTTASSAAVSANESKLLAVCAQTAAETAANGAQAAQAAALVSEGNSVNAQTTATQAAATASSNKVLAVSAAGAADQAALGALSSKQSASSFADQLSGELNVAVKDVNRIAAEVKSGLNGHYLFNNQYIPAPLQNGTNSMVPGGSVEPTLEPVDIAIQTSTNSWGTGSFGLGGSNFTTGWSGTNASFSVTSSNLKITRTNSGSNGVAEKTLSATSGRVYKIAYRYVSGGNNYLVDLIDESTGSVLSSTLPRKAVSGQDKVAEGLVTAKGNIIFRVTLSQGNVVLDNFYIATVLGELDNLDYSSKIRPDLVADTSFLTAIAPTNDYAKARAGLWRLQSATGVSAVSGKGDISSIPENYSSDLLGLSVIDPNSSLGSSTGNLGVEAVLYSPYSEASVDVYTHVHDSGETYSTEHAFIEGTSPVVETFKIKKGKVYYWKLSDSRPRHGYFNNQGDTQTLSVVFKANTRILGYYSESANFADMYNPLIPMETGPVLLSDMGNEDTRSTNTFPRFIRGAGIDLNSLAEAVGAQIDGTLASQAPNLSAALIATDSHGKAFADINASGVLGQSDVDAILHYHLNTTTGAVLSSTHYYNFVGRLYALIDKLDSEYANLEKTFTSAGSTYTLYKGIPISAADKGITSNSPYYEANNSRTHFAVTSQGNRGLVSGIPVSGLSDFYIIPDGEEVHIASSEPTIIQVFGADTEGGEAGFTPAGTKLIATIDHSAASVSSPMDTTLDAPLSGNGEVIQLLGDRPFFCGVRNGNGNSYQAFGARQANMGADSSQTAFALRVTETTSTLDAFSATITETAQSIDGLEAQYSVKINNNGAVSGFGLASTGGTTASSAFIVQADRFAIVDPSDATGFTTTPADSKIPFEINSAGNTLIKKAFVGELTADNISAGSITGDRISSSGVLEVFDSTNRSDTYAALDGTHPIYRIYAGNSDPGAAPFSVTSTGDVIAGSLNFDGPDGNYFSAGSGFGISALQEIADFVKSDRRYITKAKTVAGFSAGTNVNENSAATHLRVDLTSATDVYQKNRVSAKSLSLTHTIVAYSDPNLPMKLTVATDRNSPTRAITSSSVTFPEVILDTTTGTSTISYVSYDESDSASRKKRGNDVNYYVGDYLEINFPFASGDRIKASEASWAIQLSGGTSISLSNQFIDVPQQFIDTGKMLLKGTSVGLANLYIDTDDGAGYFAYAASDTINTKPDVKATVLDAVPRKIKITPTRWKSTGDTASAFMAGQEGYDANGARVYEAVLNATGSVGSSFYNIVTSPITTTWNSETASANIDIRSGGVGAVDSQGYLTAWTTIYQTDEGEAEGLVGAGALDAGTVYYGGNVEYFKANGSAFTIDTTEFDINSPRSQYITSKKSLVEIEGLTRFEPVQVQPDHALQIENPLASAVVTRARNNILSDNTAAYGLTFSGDSYWVIENDFTDWSGITEPANVSIEHQAMILGNVSSDPDNSNDDHLFVVATRANDSNADYVKKLNLTSKGVLYIGNTGNKRVPTADELEQGSLIPNTSNRLTFADAISQADQSNLQYNGSNGIILSLKTPSNTFKILDNTTTRFTFERTTGNFIATGNVSAFSDERLKSDIKTLDGTKVLEMRGVEFTKDGQKGSGVIAQEMEKVAPELVNSGGEYKSVVYGNIVGYLIEAIKAQDKQIKELQEKIAEILDGSSK